jgi:hypothetical protein
MFPYQPIVQDENGQFRPEKPCSYNAMVTNGFHLKRAMNIDKVPYETEEYKLKLEEAFPDHDEPVVRDIAPPTEEQMVAKEGDGYGLNLNELPETVNLEVPQGWHPNKDRNGNYMAPPSINNGWYNYGGYSSYTNPYSYTVNNPYAIPNYRNDGYPF